MLPETVPRADAVFNVQRVSLLLAALGARPPGPARRWRCRTGCTSPYRLRLFPWMSAVQAAARDAGALGCVLSGAGSSMLAAVRARADGVARAMEAALQGAGVRGRALSLRWTRSAPRPSVARMMTDYPKT